MTAHAVPLLTSEKLARLGVPHGFTTREGGVSEGPYASLNLGRTFGGGDDPARIAANLARLAGALDVDGIAGSVEKDGPEIVARVRMRLDTDFGVGGDEIRYTTGTTRFVPGLSDGAIDVGDPDRIVPLSARPVIRRAQHVAEALHVR